MPNSNDGNFSYLNRMSCNTEAQLQILTPTQPIRLRTRFIGIDPENAVIFALGTDRQWLAAKEFITQGQGVIVRIINSDDPEANIIAFRSKIKTLLNHAGRWLIIDYPSQLQSVALRQHSRIPIMVSASLHALKPDGYESKPISSGNLHDISIKGGAYVGNLVEGCEADQALQLQVKIEQSLETIAMPITVKNIQLPGDDSKECQYGFSINSDNDVNAEEFVQKVVLSHLMQQPKS